VYEWWGVHSGPGSLGGSGRAAATVEQVDAKYRPMIEDPDPSTRRFVIVVDDQDIGLIQCTRLTREPAYARATGEAPDTTASIDLLIGEADAVGRGVGPAVIDAFVEDVVLDDPRVERVVAGPHPDNRRSCRAFEKAGFVFVRDVVVPGSGPERLYARARGDASSTARPSGVRR
jgi:aminoglycoside 6'-N-acetyltransferase